MLVHYRATPSVQFSGTHFYTWVETGAVRLKCHAMPKNTTQCPQPGLKPGPLDPELSTLTMRPPRLHLVSAALLSGDFQEHGYKSVATDLLYDTVNGKCDAFQ